MGFAGAIGDGIKGHGTALALGIAATITIAVVAALVVALLGSDDSGNVDPLDGESTAAVALPERSGGIGLTSDGANASATPDSDQPIQSPPSDGRDRTPLLPPIISYVWPARNAAVVGSFLPSRGDRPPDMVTTYRILVEPGSRVVVGTWDPTRHCCSVLIDDLANGLAYSVAVILGTDTAVSPRSEWSDPVAPVADGLGASFSRGVPLADGRVLFFGGGNDGRRADLFDPAHATFSPTGAARPLKQGQIGF